MYICDAFDSAGAPTCCVYTARTNVAHNSLNILKRRHFPHKNIHVSQTKFCHCSKKVSWPFQSPLSTFIVFVSFSHRRSTTVSLETRNLFIIFQQYKFTVVYCESVNQIGYVTVDYLLIVCGNIVASVIVHVILFLHASVHMARHV